MSPPAHVLMISRDLAMRNVVEQVCRVDGYRPVAADTLSEAGAILTHQGQTPFALVVIDLRVLGRSELDTRDELASLLQAWAAPPLTIPCLYLGSVSQKYELFALRSAPVPFLTIPFSAYQFGEVARALMASDGKRALTLDGHAHCPPHGASAVAKPYAPRSAAGVPYQAAHQREPPERL